MLRRALFLFLIAGLFSSASAQEVGWVEDFDSAENWYAVGYTRDPAKQYAFTVEDGAGHFSIRDGRTGMRWITTPSGVNLRTYRNLEVRYRAKGLQTNSAAYFLYMSVNTGMTLPDPPVRLNEIVADGEWHVLRKDIWKDEFGTRYATKFVLAVLAADKEADVWVDYIKLTAPEPGSLPPAPKPPKIGFRDDLNDAAAWRVVPDAPFPGIARTTCNDGVVQFELDGMNRNAIWERRLDPPIDPDKFPYLVFKCRATGQRLVYTKNPRTMPYFMTVGDENTTKPVFGWNSLTHDGAWHVRCIGLPGKKALPNGIKFIRLNISSEDSPGATFALDDLYFAAGAPPVALADLFTVKQDDGAASRAGFVFPDFERTPNVTASELLRRYGGVDVLPTGDVTVEGIPFRIKDAAHVFGVFASSELKVECPKQVKAAYFLLSTRIEGKNDFCSWGGPIRVVEQPERFSVVLRYEDGATFESVPCNIQGKSFMMPPGIGLFCVINPRADKAIRDLSICDKTPTCGFHLIALTIQEQGEPLFAMPPCPGRLPPESAQPKRTPGDAKTVSVSKDKVALKSDCLTVGLDLTKGIRVADLASDLLGQEMQPTGRLFSLETKDGSITSDDVHATAAERVGDDGAKIAFTCEKGQPIQGSLVLKWNGPREIVASITLRNTSAKPLRGDLTVSPIDGARMDADPANVWLFYPGPGTIVTNEPFYLDELQSDHFPLQVMAAWSPARGGGLYFMTHDSTCERDKRYVLEKFDGRVSAGCRFMYLDLAPNEETTMPEFVSGAFAGDWRDALRVYRDWVKTWYKPTAPHPDWFRRLYSFVGMARTTEMCLDADGKRIDFTPHIDRFGGVFGSVDYFHIYAFGYSAKYGHYGDYNHYESLGGRECVHDEIQRLQGGGLPVGLYLDPLLADDTSLLATEGDGKKWMVLNEKGERTSWSKGNFYLCAAIPEMRRYWGDTYQRVAKEIAPRGLYMDQVGYFNPADWVCFNTTHGHKIPMGLRPAQSGLVKGIREGINQVDPTIANYSEFVPVDVVCQYQDGSFTHTHRYEWELPQCFLVNPVCLAFPEIKCFEIYSGSGNMVGENSRLPVRLAWGRESLDLGGDPTGFSPVTLANIKTLGRVWHAYPEAFATTDPQFLIPTLAPAVLANRFPSAKHDVYALFNDRPYTVDGPILAVPHAAGNTYLEAWEQQPLDPQIKDGRAILSLSVPPKMVRFAIVKKQGTANNP